jgi:hypothetical protein
MERGALRLNDGPTLGGVRGSKAGGAAFSYHPLAKFLINDNQRPKPQKLQPKAAPEVINDRNHSGRSSGHPPVLPADQKISRREGAINAAARPSRGFLFEM